MAEFKLHFRNVSMIMDCISCEKCRLWGKIQVLGLGTALKILHASRSKHSWSTLSLTRSEIIALINTFGRFCESLSAILFFHSQEKPIMISDLASLDIIKELYQRSPFILVFALLGPAFIILSQRVLRPRLQAYRERKVK